MKLTQKEAKALAKVLSDGMPENQAQRDFLAKIWRKLDDFAKGKTNA